MEALRESTGGRLALPTGTVYPALHRLEAAGLIAGSWSVVHGRRRRCYTLTDAGEQALSGRRAEWRDFAPLIGAPLAGQPRPHTPSHPTTTPPPPPRSPPPPPPNSPP